MNQDTDPRMHTAEHILNQTMIRRFGTGRCFSAHIENKKSKCDYHFERPLTPAELAGLETAVNEVIAANLPVTAEELPVAAARAEFDLGRLPELAPTIRIVRVGDYDAVPCRGTHVASTGAIGRFRLISSDQHEGVLRIRYKLDKYASSDIQT